MSYKKAAFRFFLRRAILFSKREEDLKDEIEYIVRVGEDHGYTKSFTKNLYNAMKRSMALGDRSNGNKINTQKASDKAEGYLPIPHGLRKYDFVRRLAKKENKKLASRRPPTVFNLLWNEKDPLKEYEKTGVYKIPVKTTDLET